MVELKCRAETAVTGRSACRNASCENSKERGGRIPQGKLRWGIGGPGGHSMKWYCIRPACLPADQVKDMLVPDKCESASAMEGVSELPDGFREATITCLEYIRDDKADQLDAGVLAQLDEVGPLLPVTPRAANRGEAAPVPAGGGRQGLRRVKRFMGGASSSAGADGEEEESGDESGDDEAGGGGGAMGRGGGMGGASISSLPARTPPALLIPRRTHSGHGGDSPVLPPPEKVPKLDDIEGGEGGEGSSSQSPSLGVVPTPTHPVHEPYHSPVAVSLYGGGGLSASIEHASIAGVGVGSGVGVGGVGGGGDGGGVGVVGLGMAGAAAAGAGQGTAAGSPFVFDGGGASLGHGASSGASAVVAGATDAAAPAPTGHGFEGKGAADLAGASHAAGFPAGIGDLATGSLRAPSSGAPGEGMTPSAPAGGAAAGGMSSIAPSIGGEVASPLGPSSTLVGFPSSATPSAMAGVGEGAGLGLGSGLETLGSSPDAVHSSLLGGGGDVVASALEGIGDDLIGGGDPSAPTSGAFGVGLLSGSNVVVGDVAPSHAVSLGGDMISGAAAVASAMSATTAVAPATSMAPALGAGVTPAYAAPLPAGGGETAATASQTIGISAAADSATPTDNTVPVAPPAGAGTEAGGGQQAGALAGTGEAISGPPSVYTPPEGGGGAGAVAAENLTRPEASASPGAGSFVQ